MSHLESNLESRIVELWCDRALVGLDDNESSELSQILGTSPDDATFDVAAAAITLAVAGPLEAIPADLARRVAASAAAESAGRTQALPDAAPTMVFPGRLPAPSAVPTPAAAPTAPSQGAAPPVVSLASRRPRAVLPWLAAAACLALAGGGWWQALRVDPLTLSKTDWRLPAIELPAPSPAERRAELLESPSIVRSGWTATADPAAKGATGDVVWDNEAQRGYMRFAGLARNDPTREQYQLWIFDGEKDDRYPVDGGVFDVKTDGEDVIVEIDAKLRVEAPTLFAITVEKPGGVVVSDRKRIVLTAAVRG